MRHLDVEQGSNAWLAARRGVVTASHFGDIFSAFTMKPKGAEKYLLKLLSEWALGVNQDPDVTQFMQRGSDLEANAFAYYALEKDCAPVRPGFFLRDDGKVGASPDLLVGEDGCVEVKTPEAATHIGYLLGDDPLAYKAQQQGQLWVCERQWSDFMSYHSTLPPVLLHFERDEPFIRALSEAVGAFVGELEAAKETLRKKGVVPAESPKADTTAALADVLA